MSSELLDPQANKNPNFRTRLRSVRDAVKKEKERSYALIFDATNSRADTWQAAIPMQVKLLKLLSENGDDSTQIRISYFSGHDIFEATEWTNDAGYLQHWMQHVSMAGGLTQMKRAFCDILEQAQHRKITAVLFVGDALEDEGGTIIDPQSIFDIARSLANKKIPVYLFQEGTNTITASAFSRIAEITGGLHLQFEEKNFKEMWQLIRAVIAQTSGNQLLLKAAQDAEKDEASRDDSRLLSQPPFLLDSKNG